MILSGSFDPCAFTRFVERVMQRGAPGADATEAINQCIAMQEAELTALIKHSLCHACSMSKL